MEYVGEEKKIQELFRELRLENERVTPQFAHLWHRAQAAPARPLRPFNVSFALATALLVCALVSLALWARHSQLTRQPSVVMVNAPPIPAVAPAPVATKPTKNETTVNPGSPGRKPRAIKFTVRQQPELVALKKTEIRDATMISNWVSPTASLLRSSSEQVLTTVPQFNDAVKDMKSFLPSTDKPKEK